MTDRIHRPCPSGTTALRGGHGVRGPGVPGPAKADSGVPGEDVKYVAGVPDALPEVRAWMRLRDACGDAPYGANVSSELAALETSWHLAVAYEGGELVGLGRLVSDGVLYAAVPDLVVRRGRRHDIGREILRLLLERCHRAGIPRVHVPSDSASGTSVEAHRYRVETDTAGVSLLRRV